MATRSRARSKSRSSKIEIPDLSGVESSTTISVGDYLLEVVGVEQDEGDKGPYLKWTFEVVEGKFKGAKPKPHITSFAENALFNLKNVLSALGVEIPDEAFDIDKDELIGLQCMGTIEHDSYQGRKQSVIVDFFSADGEEEEPEERGKRAEKNERSRRAKDDEKPARRGKAASKRDEPEKVAQEDVDGMDQDELENLVSELELDVDFAKLKTLRKMKAAVIDALEGADLLEAA